MQPKNWENTDDQRLAERVYAAADELITAIEDAKQNGMTITKPSRWDKDDLRDHLREITVRRDYDRASREGEEETKGDE